MQKKKGLLPVAANPFFNFGFAADKGRRTGKDYDLVIFSSEKLTFYMEQGMLNIGEPLKEYRSDNLMNIQQEPEHTPPCSGGKKY